MKEKMIGVVGGIGSYAGIDLVRKIYDQTAVTCDQDHLPVALLSVPHLVPDRTKFLLGETQVNPGFAIAELINKLLDTGAEVIGIPCNTAHAAPIFDVVKANIPESCRLLHLVEEVAKFLRREHPGIRTVGILATTGTVSTNLYPDILRQFDIEAIQPSPEVQGSLVHPAIYDPSYGIKAFSNPVTPQAKNALLAAGAHLVERGAQAIILACTEIPLAIEQKELNGSLVVDATAVLANALRQAVLQKQAPLALSE